MRYRYTQSRSRSKGNERIPSIVNRCPEPGSHPCLVVGAGGGGALATLPITVTGHVKRDVRHRGWVNRLIMGLRRLRLVRVGGRRGWALAYGGRRGENTATAYLVTLGVAAAAAGVQQAAPRGSAVRGRGEGRGRARPLRGTVVGHLHLHELAILKQKSSSLVSLNSGYSLTKIRGGKGKYRVIFDHEELSSKIL